MVQTLAEYQLEAGVIFFTSGDANPATLAIQSWQNLFLVFFQRLFSIFLASFLAFSQHFLRVFFCVFLYSFPSNFIIFLASSVHLLNDKGLASMICFMLEIFHKESEIYIQSAPNNSNESYSFMCLGRVGHFGQQKNCFKIQI